MCNDFRKRWPLERNNSSNWADVRSDSLLHTLPYKVLAGANLLVLIGANWFVAPILIIIQTTEQTTYPAYRVSQIVMKGAMTPPTNIRPVSTS